MLSLKYNLLKFVILGLQNIKYKQELQVVKKVTLENQRHITQQYKVLRYLNCDVAYY